MSAIRAHPFVAVRNTVFFPGSETAISVGRASSVAALEAALKSKDKSLVLLTQTDPALERPGLDELHSFGVLGTILSVKQREGRYDVVVGARERIRLRDLADKPYPIAQVEMLPPLTESEESEELHDELLEQTTRLFELSGVAAMSANRVAERLEKPDELVCFLASLLTLSVEEGMAVLQADRLEDAQRLTLEYLFDRLEQLESGGKPVLRLEVPGVGSQSDSVALDMLRAQVAELSVPEGIRARIVGELEKLERLDLDSDDYQEALGGLEMFLELPWDRATEDNLDLAAVEESLEQDLLGLGAVKEHLLDRLALTGNPAADVYCLHGPPGSGKRAVARAFARALGRRLEFVRLEDEERLRGQAWNLPGARPGRLFEALRRAQVMNPVIVLEADEVTPEAARALLDLMEQRDGFDDDYLGLPLDLSEVAFILVTSTLDGIGPRLRDRLQTMRLDGYSREEKRELVRKHLWDGEVELSDEAVDWLVDRHTCEAGVAELEKLLDRVAARVARVGRLDLGLLKRWLGPGEVPVPVGATALCLTACGGEALSFEALKVPGELIVTGQPLAETATIARSLVLAQLGLGSTGLHLHLGSHRVLSSDAESTGLAMAVALASALTGVAPRSEVGLAGRLSLSGRIDGCGNVRARLLAARRKGIRHLVLPRQDEAELRALPATLRKGLRFTLVDSLEQALAVALPELSPAPLLGLN